MAHGGGVSRVRGPVTCRSCRAYMVKAHFDHVHVIRHPHEAPLLYYPTLAVKMASEIWNAVSLGGQCHSLLQHSNNAQ